MKRCDCKPININILEQAKKYMPNFTTIDKLSNLFKIMGDKTRMTLLLTLNNGEFCVCDLAVLLDMTKSAVSHQLKVLKNSKLVKCRKLGKHVLYSLSDEHVSLIFEKGLEHILE